MYAKANAMKPYFVCDTKDCDKDAFSELKEEMLKGFCERDAFSEKEEMLDNAGVKDVQVKEVEMKSDKEEKVEEDPYFWEKEVNPNPEMRGYRGRTKEDIRREKKERKARLKTTDQRFPVAQKQLKQEMPSMDEFPVLQSTPVNVPDLKVEKKDEKNLEANIFTPGELQKGPGCEVNFEPSVEKKASFEKVKKKAWKPLNPKDLWPKFGGGLPAGMKGSAAGNWQSDAPKRATRTSKKPSDPTSPTRSTKATKRSDPAKQPKKISGPEVMDDLDEIRQELARLEKEKEKAPRPMRIPILSQINSLKQQLDAVLKIQTQQITGLTPDFSTFNAIIEDNRTETTSVAGTMDLATEVNDLETFSGEESMEQDTGEASVQEEESMEPESSKLPGVEQESELQANLALIQGTPVNSPIKNTRKLRTKKPKSFSPPASPAGSDCFDDSDQDVNYNVLEDLKKSRKKAIDDPSSDEFSGSSDSDSEQRGRTRKKGKRNSRGKKHSQEMPVVSAATNVRPEPFLPLITKPSRPAAMLPTSTVTSGSLVTIFDSSCDRCRDAWRKCRVCSIQVCDILHSRQIGDDEMKRACLNCIERISARAGCSGDQSTSRQIPSTPPRPPFRTEFMTPPKTSLHQAVIMRNMRNNDLSPLRDYSPAKARSPKGRVLQSAMDEEQATAVQVQQEEVQRQEDEEIIFHQSGNAFKKPGFEDVFFISKKKTEKWTSKDIKNVYVKIASNRIICIRIHEKSSLTIEKMIDQLCAWKLLDQVSPIVTFKSKPLDNQYSIESLSHNSKVCLYERREDGDYPPDTGVLFECSRCSKGFTTFHVFTNSKSHQKSCGADISLKYEELLDSKLSWGKGGLDRPGDKPWGCPDIKPGRFRKQQEKPVAEVAENQEDQEIAQIQSRGERAAYVRQAAVRVKRNAEAGLDDSSDEEDQPESTSQRNDQIKPLEDLLKGIPESNRPIRRAEMKDNLQSQGALVGRYVPSTKEEREFERLHIHIPCMTDRNKKYATLLEIGCEPCIEKVQQGDPNVCQTCRDCVPRTWYHYSSGARIVVDLFTKKLGREENPVTYSDFFALGEDSLVLPEDIVTDIINLKVSGNAKDRAIEGYRLILYAQRKHAEKNPFKFKREVKDFNNLEPDVQRAKCVKLSDAFQLKVTNVTKSIDDRNPHKIIDPLQKKSTELNREARERAGQKQFDPEEVIQMYLNDQKIKDQVEQLLELAGDEHRQVTLHELKVLTNMVIVRLCLCRCKRKELYVNMKRKEYIDGQNRGVMVWNQITDEEAKTLRKGDAFVQDFGEGIGKVRVERLKEGSMLTGNEGIVVEREIHKTSGSNGKTTIHFSPMDTLLVDSVDIISLRYRRQKGLETDPSKLLKSPLFINTRGNAVSDLDFGDFTRISGLQDITSHIPRKTAATWATKMGNINLMEAAAFSASHDLAVQQRTYLGRSTAALMAVAMDVAYHNKCTGEDTGESSEPRVQINPSYDAQRYQESLLIQKEKWRETIEREVRRDALEIPSVSRVITQHTKLSFISLVAAVGIPGKEDKPWSLDKILGHSSGHKILDVFLGSTARLINRHTRSLVLAILDFYPEEPQSKVVLANLMAYCKLFSMDVDLAENEFTKKLMESIRNYNHNPLGGGIDTTHNKLPLRVLDILGPLNSDFGYIYCWGNDKIKDRLEKHNQNEFHKLQSIKQRFLDNGGAVDVKQALRRMEQRMKARHEQQLLGHNELADRRAQQQSIQQRQEEEQPMNIDEFFDNAPLEEPPTGSPIASVRSGSSRKRLRVQGVGVDFSFNVGENQQVLISEEDLTPSKRFRRQEKFDTPSKVDSEGKKRPRNRAVSDSEKIQILEKMIMVFADPFQDARRTELKDDCWNLWDKGTIFRDDKETPIKNGVYSDSDNIAALIVGKSGLGLSKGPNAKKGLACYISQGMTKHYNGAHRSTWTKQMLRDIKDEIILQAKKDCGLV